MPRTFSPYLLVLTALVLGSPVTAKDPSIHVRGPVATAVNQALPVAETGQTLYDTQEGAHSTITATTGESIDHYYINVCTEDECVPVDPFRVKN